jgi:hypothetical protein
MTSLKRSAIQSLIQQLAYPAKIITAATEPPADPDYERRLRLWAADCAARGVHLLADRGEDYQRAIAAITVARAFAKGLIDTARLTEFDCPPGSKLYQDTRRTAFAVASEISLAAALTAQANIFIGALGATTHTRRALKNASAGERGFAPAMNELNWQVHRLSLWLSDREPAELPISTARHQGRD